MTTPGFCCYGCVRKAHGLVKSGKRHYNYCGQRQTITPDLIPHVRFSKLVYDAFNRRRNEGVSEMALRCTLPIPDTTSLTFFIHGMEPELSTNPADFEGVLPDPRYPNWELQLAHHRKINECSKRARGRFWGCEDIQVIEYFLQFSDHIGSHLENTGRRLWTQRTGCCGIVGLGAVGQSVASTKSLATTGGLGEWVSEGWFAVQ